MPFRRRPSSTTQLHGRQPPKIDPAIPLLRANLTPLPPLSSTASPALINFLTTLLSSSPSSASTSNDTPPPSPTCTPKIVLIGDASHGTSEFYTARAQLTQHLITHHGFTIVAVEADWPDAEAVDRYVRRRPAAPGQRRRNINTKPEGEKGEPEVFGRFPTWMWRNQEVQGFVEWLRGWNEANRSGGKESVGFYGLDLYSLGASMKAVIAYLEQVDGKMAERARERYGRLMVWAEDPHRYGLEALTEGFRGCEKDVMRVLRDLLGKRLEYAAKGREGEEFHGGEQNATLVKDAEQYYRAMYYDRDESWNLRDRHMFETLMRILKHRSSDRSPPKAVIWAHNSHIGDARASSMSWARGELNIGQLCREMFGRDQVLAIGCCGHTGTVAAAHRWDSDMQIMQVQPGLPDSYEALMHATGVPNFALELREGRCDPSLRRELMKKRLERFIGVIYAPHAERQSHYSSTVLPEQLDALLWFDQTRHVGALEVHQPHVPLEYDETWPFGL
ncbi:erythromycin esterase type II [Dichotomopilus funicola]|uniref:Erythromycin esterase type II n=1 Tax=Dichotomopilus funicola TaxID=1934379 RepID=A0AAN6UY81_9PEZI|nr:erythromycin esterase type II [Dichotomopilus funicola]